MAFQEKTSLPLALEAQSVLTTPVGPSCYHVGLELLDVLLKGHHFCLSGYAKALLDLHLKSIYVGIHGCNSTLDSVYMNTCICPSNSKINWFPRAKFAEIISQLGLSVGQSLCHGLNGYN